MKLNKILIYLSILVALVAYVYFVEIRHKRNKQASEEKAARIVQMEKDKIVRIELASHDKGKIELKKPAKTWVLTSPIKTKADEAAVASLLQSIADAKSEKVVLKKGAKWAEYGLDKPEFSVSLATKDKTADVHFGSANPAKTSYYVRVDDQPRLLLVPDTLKISLNKSAFDLRDKTVVSISPDQVDRIAVSTKGKEIELQREAKDKWAMVKPERIRVKATLVAGDLRTLTNLTAKSIIDNPTKEGDPYGLDNPEETILMAGKKREQTLLVGAPEKKQDIKGTVPNRYARIKGRDDVYVIDGQSLKSLKTGIEELRDRSLLTFNPGDIEKLEVTLGGRTWLAFKGKDNKWLLEKPVKKEKMDAWPVTRILWDLKDLQWKTETKPAPADLASVHLDKPQLTVSLFKKGTKEPLILKAGWEVPAVKEEQGKKSQPSGEKKAETSAKAKGVKELPASAKVPEKVNVLTQPSLEQGAIFSIDSGFVTGLRTDLKRLTEKK